MGAVPEEFRICFWNADFDGLDLRAHRVGIIGRILEYGDLAAVRWLLDTYGPQEVHDFFREGGHPELSEYTINFWKTFFRAEGEVWEIRPAWRRSSPGPWAS